MKMEQSCCALPFIESMKIITSEIRATLGNNLTEDQREKILTRFSHLKEAFGCFEKQRAHPELVLAVTGTTSSGKSTLANFLIGESILPVAVQEMSAGLVKVKHSHKRSLTIPKTRGATWEIGIWENLTANEISKRLEDTMNAFRRVEESNKEIEPVVFEIEWPIRLAERKKELGLPEGTQVTILDLPGFKAVNDERNGAVIRKNIAKAFCLMAYNAEETDRVKQKTLLNQVVNQVMALSYVKDEDETQTENVTEGNVSLLRRMLFLLNRIDVFWRHDDAVEQLEKFKAEVTDQLREELEEVLPGYEDVIHQIEFTQICSLPALLAIEANRLWEEPDEQAKILKKIERGFEQIFHETYFEQFPCNFKKLEKDQRREIINETLERSYAYEFEKYLSSHLVKISREILIGGSFDEALQKTVRGLLTDLVSDCESCMVQAETLIEYDFYANIKRHSRQLLRDLDSMR